MYSSFAAWWEYTANALGSTTSTSSSKTAEEQQRHSGMSHNDACNGEDGGTSCSSKDSLGAPSADDVDLLGNTNRAQNVTEESVYDYYKDTLYPAIMASLPVLLDRLFIDCQVLLKSMLRRLVGVLIPSLADLLADSSDIYSDNSHSLRKRWEQSVQALSSASNSSAMAEFMLGHFDSNNDGHISPSELLHFGEMAKKWDFFSHQNHQISWWSWFSREWPLFEWKLGVFIFRTFGGLLLALAVLSIIPGRLHGISGKILRWPVLGLTYFLVMVELAVYVVIRLFIRVAEGLVATPRHRKLRNLMRTAGNYDEWFKYAKQLDISKDRHLWQRTVRDQTSKRYNWSFIQELMNDMKLARTNNDVLQALAVLQQCTRKNVGGIMSEDLFSYTYTGEPKHIVRNFIQEVVTTLHWVTDEANRADDIVNQQMMDQEAQNSWSSPEAKKSYEDSLEREVRKEKEKIWKSLMEWATLNFTANDGNHKAAAAVVAAAAAATNNKTRRDDSTNNSIDDEEDFVSRCPLSPTAPKPLPSASLVHHREQLIQFLKRARASYGRTALCLSGGAMMGLYHFGHIVGLLECGLLPTIVSGTSAGSVIGSILCTRTDEELKRDLKPEVIIEKLTCFERPWKDRIKGLCTEGTMFKFEDWMKLIKWFTCGDMTFEEAYKKTGRTFCITLSATTKKAPPILINHHSAPNVTIASAVVASAAVPFFIPPVCLQYKDADGIVRVRGSEMNNTKSSTKDQTYFDGSIDNDIPTNGLAEMLNCHFFIACQANPHVVPFFYNGKGGVGSPSRWVGNGQEDSWRGGFLLAALEMYLKNDMKAKMRFLNDIEAAIGFTSTMLTQEFVGSTTIVPEVTFWDFFKLFSDPSLSYLYQCFQAGSVASYQHCAMIKLHYSIADALEECLVKLESRSSKNEVIQNSPFKQSSKNQSVGGQLDEAEEDESPTKRRSTISLKPTIPILSDSEEDDEYNRSPENDPPIVTTSRSPSYYDDISSRLNELQRCPSTGSSCSSATSDSFLPINNCKNNNNKKHTKKAVVPSDSSTACTTLTGESNYTSSYERSWIDEAHFKNQGVKIA